MKLETNNTETKVFLTSKLNLSVRPNRSMEKKESFRPSSPFIKRKPLVLPQAKAQKSSEPSL